MKRLHIKEGSSHEHEFMSMAEEASRLARPKALYKLAFIDEKAEDSVIIDGIRFTSRVLRVNLEETQRVFAYVATCGTELDEWSSGFQDMLQQYWADAIKEAALLAAIQALNDHLNLRYAPGLTSTMHPGSLEDWPIQQQVPLFELLGDTETFAGVRLTESCLMRPIKTVSGLRFPLQSNFESCQLCPREGCPGRKAPYEPELYGLRFKFGADLSGGR
jgi:hypothetical protein